MSKTKVENNSPIIEKTKNRLSEVDQKTRFQLLFLYIITFGIFYFYLQDKVKQTQLDSNNKLESDTLKTSTNIPFELKNFINGIGEMTNVVSIDASLNTIKIVVKDIELIKRDELQKMGVKGIMITNDKLSLVVGDFANTLKDELNKLVPIMVVKEIEG